MTVARAFGCESLALAVACLQPGKPPYNIRKDNILCDSCTPESDDFWTDCSVFVVNGNLFCCARFLLVTGLLEGYTVYGITNSTDNGPWNLARKMN